MNVSMQNNLKKISKEQKILEEGEEEAAITLKLIQAGTYNFKSNITACQQVVIAAYAFKTKPFSSGCPGFQATEFAFKSNHLTAGYLTSAS